VAFLLRLHSRFGSFQDISHNVPTQQHQTQAVKALITFTKEIHQTRFDNRGKGNNAKWQCEFSDEQTSTLRQLTFDLLTTLVLCEVDPVARVASIFDIVPVLQTRSRDGKTNHITSASSSIQSHLWTMKMITMMTIYGACVSGITPDAIPGLVGGLTGGNQKQPILCPAPLTKPILDTNSSQQDVSGDDTSDASAGNDQQDDSGDPSEADTGNCQQDDFNADPNDPDGPDEPDDIMEPTIGQDSDNYHVKETGDGTGVVFIR
jgi:hypothetical protein